jgi:monofunctional chorismate mutase
MDKLQQARLNIDELDKQIMDLLDKRFDLSIEVGKIKQANSTQVLDTNREQIILDKITKYSHSPQISTIYKTIMNESKSLQRK